MADRLTVAIGADATQLQAQLAVANAAVRAYTRELNSAASTARKAQDDLSMAKVGQVQANVNAATSAVAKLKTELLQLGTNAARSGGGLTTAGGAIQQLSFQFNDLFTQIASGTSVWQALAQQGGQIVQVFQQTSGATDLLTAAFSALKSPMGLATLAFAAAAGGLYLLRTAANEAEKALQGVYNQAFASGRDPAAAERNFKAIRDLIAPPRGGFGGGRAGMSETEANPIAAAIASIPRASKEAIDALAGVADAWRRIQFGGDAEKTAEAIRKLFASPAALKELIESAGQRPGTRLEEQAAGVLAERYGPAATQLRERMTSPYGYGVRRRPGGPGQLPGFENVEPFPEGRAAPPVRIPSDDEIEANKLINDQLRERAALVEKIATIHRALGNNEIKDVEAARTTIKDYERQIEEIDKRRNKPAESTSSKMQELRRQLDAEQAGIATRGGGAGGSYQANLESMIAAGREAGVDIGVTSGTRSRERQQQLWDAAVAKYGSEAAARKWVAPPGSSMHERGMAADLSFGPGGKEWAHANASRFGLTFPMGHEPWHVEPVGGRGAGGGNAAALQSSLNRNEVAFWERQAATAKAGSAELAEIEQELAQARIKVAKESAASADRSASEATRAVERQAREQEQARKNAERDFLASLAEEERAGKERAAKIKEQADAVAKAVDAWAAPFKSAFSSIEGSLSTGLSGLVTGATTWGKALQNVGNRAVEGLTTAGLTTLSKFGARAIDSTATGTLGDLAGKWIGDNLFKVASSTAADTTGVAATTAAMGTMAAATTTAMGTMAASTTAAMATMAAAVAGGQAVQSGAAVADVFVPFAKGGIVPSAAAGWALPSFAGAQPALLHSKEMVLPAHISEGLQGAISKGGLGGGVTFNLNAVAADGPAIERLFRSNGRLITDAVKSGIRSNALTPRSI
jgi:LAS superfamily LD-carboxypeptidase LdcB